MILFTNYLGATRVDPPPPGCTSINHQTANGIQEVDGSIPFGSTKDF